MVLLLEMKVMSKRVRVCVRVYICICFLLYFNVEIYMISVSLCFEKCENNWFGINKIIDILKG